MIRASKNSAKKNQSEIGNLPNREVLGIDRTEGYD